MKSKAIQQYEYTTLDAALKQVERLVVRGYQCAIAPLDGGRRGYSVSAPDRTADFIAPTKESA